jgi:hypothetical protein
MIIIIWLFIRLNAYSVYNFLNMLFERLAAHLQS